MQSPARWWLAAAAVALAGCGRSHASHFLSHASFGVLERNAAAAMLPARPRPARAPRPSACPPEMARVGDVCVDRWEATLVERTPDGGTRVHPYYEQPDPGVTYVARSSPGVFPQAYINRPESAAACRAAGKRLCTLREWFRACRGAHKWPFPYGAREVAGLCNTGKAHLLGRFYGENPRFWSYEHVFNDPRLDQVPGFLARTGAYSSCVSSGGIYDMVGNLDEWVSDTVRRQPKGSRMPAREVGHGVFMGGFYSTRDQHGEGCGFITVGHQPGYHDYSLGFRCCKSIDRSAARAR